MDINKVLEELDGLFAQKRISEVEGFLLGKLKDAEEVDDITSIITLVNELIGFYRASSRFNDSIVYCDYIISVMEDVGLKRTIHYATTLLNVATAYRAAGKLEQSLEFYDEVLELYNENLNKNDLRFASLYNNMSLLYQELKQFEKACECLENALSIVVLHKDTEIEIAVTHSNLAMSLLKLNKIDEAINHIIISLEIFEKGKDRKDFHYPSALAAMGEAQFKLKNYDKAVEYYIKSLHEIKANIGENNSYAITCDNLAIVYDEIGNKEEADKFRAKAKEVHEKLNK